MKKAFLKVPVCFFFAAIMITSSGCEKNETTATVMLVHAAPGTPNSDLYLQGNLKESNIAYGSNSAYQEVTSKDGGQFTADIRDSIADTSIVSIFNPAWIDRKKYSIVMYGEPSEVAQGIFSDDFSAPTAGKAKVRFIHLSPNAPALDVLANDEEVVTNKVYYGSNSFNASTGFEDVVAGVYKVDLRINGTSNIAFSVNNINFADGKVYTLYAKGFVNGPGYLKLGLGIVENN